MRTSSVAGVVRGTEPATRRLLTVLLVGLLLVAPGTAWGQSVETVAEQLETSGGYGAGGATLSDGEADELAAAFARAGARFGVVALDAPADGGATVFADRLLEAVLRLDVVLVVTPADFGAQSAIHDQVAVERALDAAAAAFERSDAAGIEAFGESLFGVQVSVDAGGASTAAGAAGEAGFPWGVLLFVGLVVVGIVLLVRRSRAKDAEDVAARIEEARDEVREDLEAMADHILDLSDRVLLADDAELQARYDEAVGIYRDALAEIEVLEDPAEIRDLDEEVELARWQMEVVLAALDGTPAPARPAPKPDVAAMPAPPPPAPSPQQPRRLPPADMEHAPRRRTTRRQQRPDWANEEIRQRQRDRRPHWYEGQVTPRRSRPTRRSRSGGLLGGLIEAGVRGMGNRSRTGRTTRATNPVRRSGGVTAPPSSRTRSDGGSRRSTTRGSSTRSRGGGGRRRSTGGGGRTRGR